MQTLFKNDLRKISHWLTWLAALQILLLLIEVPLSWRGFAGYVPLHNLLETTSIVVAGMVLSVGWTAMPTTTPAALMVLACTFAGVALLDFSHMLSFMGMPDFVTPSSTEKAINFWLAARLMAAAALLWVVIASWRVMASVRTRYLTMAGVLLLTALVHGVVLFAPHLTPRTFIQGQGLTAFKVGAEYFIIVMNLVAAGLLLQRMRAVQAFNAPWLLGAVVTMAMSEFFFTQYADVTDVFNLMGHIYKVVSYLFLFRAIYLHTVRKPYSELAEVQNSLRATLAALPDLVFEMGLDGEYFRYHSPPDSDLLVLPPDYLIGRKVSDLMPKEAADAVLQILRDAHEKGRATGTVIVLDLPVGKRWFELSASRKNRTEGEEARIVVMSRDVTQRLQWEQQLRLQGLAIANLSDLVLITEAEPVEYPGPRIVFVNEAFVRRTGYTHAEAEGKTTRLLHGPRTSADQLAQIRERMLSKQAAHAELIYYTRSREEFWVELDIAPLAEESGRCTHWVAVIRDVTERVQSKEALRGMVQHTQAILDNMADGVITAGPDGLIRSFSKAATQIFGYSAEEAIGRNLSILMPSSHGNQHDSYLRHYQRTGEARIIGKPRDVEGKRRDGQVFPMSLSITKTEHEGQTTFIGLVRDITQRRMDEEVIRRLAYYDGLTGLPNRRLLIDHLHHAMQTCSRSEMLGALMFMDLDHFKVVNDTLGHPVGDELLKHVATRLQATMREGDIVSRMGGDEFVLVLENLSRHADEAAARAEGVANKVLQALAQPYLLAGRELVCTSSVGIVLFGNSPQAYDELMKDADSALYQAKAAGRNTFCFFDPDMQAAAVARNQLEEDLRRGIENNELLLFYQLQVQGSAARPTGVEALVRWVHPKRGMVSPGEFIPLAEETGLVLPIGLWVLQTACAQLVEWTKDPLTRELTIAVNVSAQQFAQASFVADVEAALQRTGARPDLLKIELTESALAANLDDIVLKINALRERGVLFSLDDFGTGYSSLNYLKRLPLYQLKIDQSFVRDLLTDPNDAAIANTIVALGISLGLQVIAEGVETEGQRDSLQQMGCNAYQGYLFGRPMRALELVDALRARAVVA